MSTSAFDELAARLAAPAKSGAYLTRNELVALARVTEGSLRYNERKRMLADVFKSAPDADGLVALLDRLQEFWRDQLSRYDELAAEFPTSAPFFADWQTKARATLASLAKIRDEVRL
ncbi:MAG: hypothetical protein AB1938_14490 [Myxococcota bacterium]